VLVFRFIKLVHGRSVSHLHCGPGVQLRPNLDLHKTTTKPNWSCFATRSDPRRNGTSRFSIRNRTWVRNGLKRLVTSNPTDLGSLTVRLSMQSSACAISMSNPHICLISNRELKGEAERIRVFDHAGTPYLSRPARRVDHPQIDADVLDALKYLRCAAFAMQQPKLRQDTGIFVSDGAIPESLHREVSQLVLDSLFFQTQSFGSL
jgi:hypothetical protein